MQSTKYNALHIIDLVILAAIFFYSPIITSFHYFTELQQAGLAAPENLEFSEADNYSSIGMELLSLGVAWLYLMLRKFQFAQLPFSFNKNTLPLTLALILFTGAICHLFANTFSPEILTEPTITDSTLMENATPAQTESENLWDYFSLSLILFALLNGFYEEIFFLGLVFCVEKKWLPFALIFALIVRFAFHTYQGLFSATVVFLFGVLLMLLRFKIRNVVPFMLAHSFFDVFGLGLPLWLFTTFN
ncbi:CPBP family intramembrane glutamic endopeptidase [Actinobacillus seminis]|uniref:CPBP family intramembrane glutamic endopeptidase n=1 Tax=Actinobacillus seminis TaxID=722 RepID=UPI003B94598F